MGTFGLGLGLGFSNRRLPFNPVYALFGSGEPGYIIPWLPGTVWKDTAGTVPCTAPDDLIARADDISGNGNHFIQATEGKRPKWQTDGTYYWALADGAATAMATASAVDFSTSDKLSIWAGFRKASDASLGVVLETSPNAITVPGTAAIIAPAANGSTSIGFTARGDAAVGGRNGASVAAPATLVVSCGFDIAGAALTTEIFPRINGAVPTLVSAGSTLGGGNFSNAVQHIAARSGTAFYFNGRIYPLIARGGPLPSAELNAKTEGWVNDLTGAY